MSSADNFFKQFGPRSGPTKCRAWSGSKLFDTLVVFLKEFFKKNILKNSADDKKACKFHRRQRQAFKWALLFLFFLLFPTFLICSYFSLLFHENALLSLLFHSKMSFTRKNPEIFPRSLRSLRFYKLTSMFFQGARCLTPQIFILNLKVSLFRYYFCHRYYPAHLIWNYLYKIARCNEFYIWKSPTIPTFLHR